MIVILCSTDDGCWPVGLAATRDAAVALLRDRFGMEPREIVGYTSLRFYRDKPHLDAFFDLVDLTPGTLYVSDGGYPTREIDALVLDTGIDAGPADAQAPSI